jgi:hypothetical protein
MGCGASSAAAQEAQPQAQSSASAGVKLLPGQAAIIWQCPLASLNGERVVCEKYNADLGEWWVKGDRFPLTVGMSLGAQFLHTPTLLNSGSSCSWKFHSSGSRSGKLVQGEPKDLFRTKLEQKCKALSDCSREEASEVVSDVHEHAYRIIQEGSGLGPSGECPFASACAVDLYYQFCLKVFAKWSGHKMGEDERVDNVFFSQISDLCEILGFLDTDAVPLPEETCKNIQWIQRQGLFPNWVRGMIPNGEDAVRLCLVIGKKWQLEDTKAFQEALASLETNM